MKSKTKAPRCTILTESWFTVPNENLLNNERKWLGTHSLSFVLSHNLLCEYGLRMYNAHILHVCDNSFLKFQTIVFKHVQKCENKLKIFRQKFRYSKSIWNLGQSNWYTLLVDADQSWWRECKRFENVQIFVNLCCFEFLGLILLV